MCVFPSIFFLKLNNERLAFSFIRRYRVFVVVSLSNMTSY